MEFYRDKVKDETTGITTIYCRGRYNGESYGLQMILDKKEDIEEELFKMMEQKIMFAMALSSKELFPDFIGVSGRHTIEGQCYRSGDPRKHLGPPGGFGIPEWSQLFQTRCGLDKNDGPFSNTRDDDDVWCVNCLAQAGIPFVIEEI